MVMHNKWRGLLLLLGLALVTISCQLTQQVFNTADDDVTPAARYTSAVTQEAFATSTPERTPRPSGPASTPGLMATPAGPGEEADPGSAVQAYLALDENGAQPAAVFGQGNPIYLYGTLNIDGEANLHTVWTAVEAEGNQPETVVHTFAPQSFQSGPFWFRLEWPRPWALGQYRVDLYVNDVLERELAFEVTETNSDAASLSEVNLALDDTGLEPTDVFGPGDTFYIHFVLDTPQPGTPVRVVWSAKQVEGLEPNSYLNEYVALMDSGPNWLSIRQAQPWALGEYGADVYINGQLAQSLVFEVASTNPDGLTLSGGADDSGPYTARDEAGAEPSDAFSGIDSIYVHFSLADDVPDDTVVTVSLAAVDETGYHTFLDKFRDVFSSGEYYIYFSPETTWTPGAYRIYLYVNGDLAGSIDLIVQ